MKHLSYLLILLLIISCQDSKNTITDPNDSANPLDQLSKFSPTNDLVLHESGYNQYILADNLITPEGVAFYPRAKGLLIGQSTIGNVIKLDDKGSQDEFVNLDLPEPPGIALIDLLADFKRGVFMTVLRHGQIFLLDKSNNVTEFASGLNYPLFMELDYKHNLYVSELFGECITRIDQLGNKQKIIDFTSVSSWNPRGIVFNYKEQLFVLSGRYNEVWMFDLKKSNSFPIDFTNGKHLATLEDAVNAQDITIGFKQDLFIVDYNNIWRLDKKGNVTLFASGLIGQFNTIHSTTTGNLIVTDYGGGKVYGISKNKFKIN